ncbi:hypothetical protein LOK49_LG09G01655 [Camellia lanceoleosa]|uniref:Uncharacterized protein n=1 Tax=Camellia lanceoleosa TaxID=1840588 RepID=A0ACC0GGR4_9ERIC|nr:hypothetical protein LOK49_LG09G01655 [Camellia lanceoleosa]
MVGLRLSKNEVKGAIGKRGKRGRRGREVAIGGRMLRRIIAGGVWNCRSQPLHHDDPSNSLDDSITHCCSNYSGSSISPNNSIESSVITDLHNYKSIQSLSSFLSYSYSQTPLSLSLSLSTALSRSLEAWFFNCSISNIFCNLLETLTLPSDQF